MIYALKSPGGFIDSIRKQVEQGRRPTPKQIETLDRVWEHATARG